MSSRSSGIDNRSCCQWAPEAKVLMTLASQRLTVWSLKWTTLRKRLNIALNKISGDWDKGS